MSECLTELARTHDQHAVLVLQPAVEAFFLVHAGDKQKKKKDSDKKREENQTAHLHLDLPGPMSPAHPSQGNAFNLITTTMSPCQVASNFLLSVAVDLTQSSSQLGAALRQDSILSTSAVSVSLPPDTQKFLRFAGLYWFCVRKAIHLVVLR